jgi:hypothetical protein
MKKLITFAVLSLLLMPVTQCFAASAMDVLGTTDGAILGFTPSNKVILYYGNQDDGTNAQTYVAIAKHTGGDRAYGTTTKTNLLVTNQDDDCVSLDALACIRLGTTNATEFNANDNGDDNIDGLTNWNIL